MEHVEAAAYYVSPLGRAQDTASLTLERVHRTATTCEWLQEFPLKTLERADSVGTEHIIWDWVPEDWTSVEEFHRRDLWMEHPAMRHAVVQGTDRVGVRAEYERVTGEFDKILAKHGYVRDGELYRVERANRDTIVFFCHFGLECVLLSHLLDVSPMYLWHGTMAAPSSVTTLYTEERRKGKACFRIASFGDISHLYAGGEEPSFAGRFCETYDCMEERHD
jgi:probable phosphoglycerate mutase